MKATASSHTPTTHRLHTGIRCALVGLLALTSGLHAQQSFNEARLTQAINEVAIIRSGSLEETPALVDATLHAPDIVKTGRRSRAELAAPDGSITRVGANTLFSFEPNSRTLNLQQGNVLIHTPSGKGGARIVTASASAAVLGTTLAISTTPEGGFKCLCLEGRAQIVFPNGQTQSLLAGQMTFVLPPPPSSAASGQEQGEGESGGEAGPVVSFDLQKSAEGSSLLNGFDAPLPSLGAITQAIQTQQQQLASGELESTGLLIVSAPSNTQLTVAQSSLIEQNLATTNSNPLLNALATTLTVTGLPPATNIFTGAVSFSLQDIFGNAFSPDASGHTANPYQGPGPDVYAQAFPFVGIVAGSMTVTGQDYLPYPNLPQYVYGRVDLSSFGGTEVLVAARNSIVTTRETLQFVGLEKHREFYILAGSLSCGDFSSVSLSAEFGTSAAVNPYYGSTQFGLLVVNAFTRTGFSLYNSSGSVDFFSEKGLNLTNFYVSANTNSGKASVESKGPITLAGNLHITGKTVNLGSSDSGLLTLSSTSAYAVQGDSVSVRSGSAITLDTFGIEGVSSGQPASSIQMSAPTLSLTNGTLRTQTLNLGRASGSLPHLTSITMNGTSLLSMTSINMEAQTINLQNINFPAGSTVHLRSSLGGTADGVSGSGPYPHFGSSAVGRVNFISGVQYGGMNVNAQASFGTYGSNIQISSLP